MKSGIKPASPAAGLTAEEGDPVEVARSLEEALRLLEDCQELQDVLGKRFIDAYVGVKRAEFETFNKVISSWEREFLLLTV